MGYETVLFIGPNYKNHKGGIGAVLEIYANNVQPFNFLCSYDGNYKAMGNAWLFLICIFRLFFKLAADGKIQIVHIHGASNGSFYRKYLLFLIAKFVFSKKVLYHIHGGGFKCFYEQSGRAIKGCVAHFIQRADGIICLSKSWGDYFSDHFNPKAVIIIRNPIELVNGIKLEKIRTVQFLFLGKICNQKGVFDLLNIINENSAAYQGKAIFRFGGNGEVDHLVDFIAQNKLEQLVSFEGWVTGSSKHELLSSAHVYILPSYVEGMPISVLEAMNYGLPVISTKVGGIPEIVLDQINGFLVNPGDKKAIKSAIDHFVHNPYDIMKMGLQARRSCFPFDIKTVLPHLERLYGDLLLMR